MSASRPPGADQRVEFAPAKINLTLRVGPVRADGYHPVDSLVVFARDWGDAIAVEPAETLTLAVTGPNARALEGVSDNLVLKAAYALRAAGEASDRGARITLEKHLPAAAGIGGGSADAAAALRALNTLWALEFSTRQLAEIGSVVGSDVPACVHGAPLRMTGRGERIQRLAAWPALHAVLLHPGAALSTGVVFAAYDADAPAPLADARTPAAGDAARAIAVLQGSANDLQAPARRLAPDIGAALDALASSPGAALARMSGSGATCFALYASSQAAQTAAAALEGSRPGWTARAVMLEGVRA